MWEYIIGVIVVLVLLLWYYSYEQSAKAAAEADAKRKADDATAAKAAADKAAADKAAADKAAADAIAAALAAQQQAAEQAKRIADAEAARRAAEAQALADAQRAAAIKAAYDAKIASDAKEAADQAAIIAAYNAKIAAATAASVSAATAAQSGGTYTVNNPDGSFSYKAIPLAVTTPPPAPTYNPDVYTWNTLQGDYNTTGRLIGEPGVYYYGTFYDPADSGSGRAQCLAKCKSDQNCWSWTWNRNNGYRGNQTVGECYGRDNDTHTLSNGAVTNYYQYGYNNPWGGFVSGYRN